MGLSSLLAFGHDGATPHGAMQPRRASLAASFWTAASGADASQLAPAVAVAAASKAARAASEAVRTAFPAVSSGQGRSSASSLRAQQLIPPQRAAPRHSAAAQGSSFLTNTLTKEDNFEWRKRHNYNLDGGQKFAVTFKTPSIVDTDLFDLEKFGCNGDRGMTGGRISKLLNKDYGKEWWRHPEFTFGSVVGRVGITLQDVTSGEIKWDAVYELADDSNFLMNDDKPIGGSHPFFQPDWCPAPPGATSHRYLLTIKNLGELPEPGLETIGSMMFTQYTPTNLDHTYTHENAAPPEPGAEPAMA